MENNIINTEHCNERDAVLIQLWYPVQYHSKVQELLGQTAFVSGKEDAIITDTQP